MLTQKRLKEVLYYNPETGIFIWIKPSKYHPELINKKAGYNHPHNYIYIDIDYKKYKASRLAWLYMEGYFPEFEVDHRDRIRNNDKWENLRHVTRSDNMKNKSLYKNNKTKITGVNWAAANKKWRASIGHLGKKNITWLFF